MSSWSEAETFLSALNCFGIFVKNQLTIYVWVISGLVVLFQPTQMFLIFCVDQREAHLWASCWGPACLLASRGDLLAGPWPGTSCLKASAPALGRAQGRNRATREQRTQEWTWFRDSGASPGSNGWTGLKDEKAQDSANWRKQQPWVPWLEGQWPIEKQKEGQWEEGQGGRKRERRRGAVSCHHQARVWAWIPGRWDKAGSWTGKCHVQIWMLEKSPWSWLNSQLVKNVLGTVREIWMWLGFRKD